MKDKYTARYCLDITFTDRKDDTNSFHMGDVAESLKTILHTVKTAAKRIKAEEKHQ